VNFNLEFQYTPKQIYSASVGENKYFDNGCGPKPQQSFDTPDLV